VCSDSAIGVCRLTGIFGDFMAKLTSAVPTTTPVTIEIVARPKPISTTSGAPTS